MAQTLHLHSYQPSATLASFLALRFPNAQENCSATFSPAMMRWDDRTYIFDLRHCGRFWANQAERARISLEDVLRQIMQSHFPDAQAVCAAHPWRALVALNALAERSPTPTLVHAEGPFGRQLFSELSFATWFSGLEELSRKHVACKSPGFSPARFKSKRLQWQRATERLGLNGPHELESATPAAIKRRYGPFLAQAWEWTFATMQSPMENAAGLFWQEQAERCYSGFPWQSWEPPQQPSVERYLEGALSAWDHIEGLLCQDLNKLCRNKDFAAHEQVTCLTWQLTLYNMRTLTLSIRFRNPHSLHRERGEQKTALLQASYSYEAAMRHLRERDDDLDLPTDIPLQSWKLVVSERLQLPDAIAHKLFHSLEPEEAELSAITALENKLPIALERYEVADNHLPEEASRRKEWSPASFAASWHVSGCQRPLFIRKRPEPWQEGRSTMRVFLERSSVKWWARGETGVARDYYRLVDSDFRSHWLFRSQDGHWYRHGSYS